MTRRSRRWRWVPLGVAAALVLPAPVAGQGASEPGLIDGTVIDYLTDEPMAGVVVWLSPVTGDGSGARTVESGGEGEFFFADVAPGFYALAATHAGYATFSDTLLVQSASHVELRLPLSVSPVRLEAIVVSVNRVPLGLRGFERRRRTQQGIFLDRATIDERNPQQFTDLLRPVAGVRLVPTASFGYELLFRNGCVPEIWLDGTKIGSNVDVDDFLRPEDLEALEVYRGTELPGEFGTNLCGAVVAWTRRGDPSDEPRNIRRQVLWGAIFLVIALIAR